MIFLPFHTSLLLNVFLLPRPFLHKTLESSPSILCSHFPYQYYFLEVTFQRGNSQSRIDFIFITDEYNYLTQNVKIVHFPFSDHDGVSLSLFFTKLKNYCDDFSPFSYQFTFERILAASAFSS
jgi:hypothetical protein